MRGGEASKKEVRRGVSGDPSGDGPTEMDVVARGDCNRESDLAADGGVDVCEMVGDVVGVAPGVMG